MTNQRQFSVAVEFSSSQLKVVMVGMDSTGQYTVFDVLTDHSQQLTYCTHSVESVTRTVVSLIEILEKKHRAVAQYLLVACPIEGVSSHTYTFDYSSEQEEVISQIFIDELMAKDMSKYVDLEAPSFAQQLVAMSSNDRSLHIGDSLTAGQSLTVTYSGFVQDKIPFSYCQALMDSRQWKDAHVDFANRHIHRILTPSAAKPSRFVMIDMGHRWTNLSYFSNEVGHQKHW